MIKRLRIICMLSGIVIMSSLLASVPPTQGAELLQHWIEAREKRKLVEMSFLEQSKKLCCKTESVYAGGELIKKTESCEEACILKMQELEIEQSQGKQQQLLDTAKRTGQAMLLLYQISK